ncbi:MAG: phospholipase D family protein [Giesbergeria sp.]|uniref:phospholipase D family protein n=1 Tax=Giesbergeria sp. TaxID=2818473 RepID=UPI00260B83C3|nr:phospholipase D family protein [Giesbergeria sp.]MDD2609877.1 phospholipase D family protein [Giesbergeria sp.]
MPVNASIQLVTNLVKGELHADQVNSFLATAVRFECFVAFANENGLDLFWDQLIEKLDTGELTCRFVVGFNFYHTDPNFLYAVQELVIDYPNQVEFYVSGEESKLTFHPKIYYFGYPDNTYRVIAGSANLTQGGLSLNHEASLAYESGSQVPSKHAGHLGDDLTSLFDHLLKTGEIEEATPEALDEYARRHQFYALHRKVAENRARQSCVEVRPVSGAPYLAELEAVLEIMRADKGTNGFAVQAKRRATSIITARQHLDNIAHDPALTRAGFLAEYEGLVGRKGGPPPAWHSGNLNRRRATVADSFGEAQAALLDLEAKLTPTTSPSAAYSILSGWLHSAAHVGPNVMSEILHTFDKKRFAILNKNSVSGMHMAGFLQFPLRTLKTNVTAAMYEEFCEKAELVRAGLGLKDLSELDAVFNYAYW